MENLSFSSLKETDLEDVLEIEKVSFSTPWSMGMFRADLCQRDFSFFIVARLDNKIVGYGGFWLVMDEAHLGNLAVHPDFRGQGIGERILKELIEIGKSRGVNLMTLEVRETNLKARSLYEKMGFKMMAIRKGYYRDTNEDAYVYIKELLG